MQQLFLLLISIMVFVAFLANPAPQSIELLDLVLLVIPFIIGVLCLATPNFGITIKQNNLTLAIIFYLCYLIISTIMGLIQGLPILNILRSVGPYINFFPLILLGYSSKSILKPLALSIILISAGLIQVSYLSYLYFSHTHAISNTTSVLVNRITFLDPRTTLPFLLVVPLLPVIFFDILTTTAKKLFLHSLAIGLILTGLFAGIITLTRAIFLSIVISWIVFIVLYLWFRITIMKNSISYLLQKNFAYILIITTIVISISFIPKIHLLELGLISRFTNHTGMQTDYTNGRLYDEWLPAFSAWAESGLLGWLFGIGAGNTFSLPTGEERTYIHNLSIYSLVYGGFYGLLATIILYLTLFKSLITKACQKKSIVYIAYASLLIGIFFYGQLFAVHKVLAFNMILFLIIVLALEK